MTPSIYKVPGSNELFVVLEYVSEIPITAKGMLFLGFFYCETTSYIPQIFYFMMR
jgi:hypothetical protein